MATCSICRRPGARLDAGGDMGMVHWACFNVFDRHQEALEREGSHVFRDMPLPVGPARVRRIRGVRCQTQPQFVRVEVCL